MVRAGVRLRGAGVQVIGVVASRDELNVHSFSVVTERLMKTGACYTHTLYL